MQPPIDFLVNGSRREVALIFSAFSNRASLRRLLRISALILLASDGAAAIGDTPGSLKEINPPVVANPMPGTAIVGATLLDGRGGPPVSNSVVLVRGDKIASVGTWPGTGIPAEVQFFDARGLTLVPGLMDSHFHIERDYELPRLYLSHGVTSVRDPGQWLEIYEPIKKSTLPQPRCFVAGPHLDAQPHAHPQDAFEVTTAEETRAAVNRFVDEGASHIKVYYRLPLDSIRVVCDSAHQRGVPVTAHLELVDAGEAIGAGLDGIEHVTSFGTALAEKVDAEKFREAVRNDNEARRKARYELWSKQDLDHSPRVQPLIDLIMQRKIFLSPTLAVFEKRAGDKGVSDTEARGYENMLKFVRLCHRAGAAIVVGSHSSVPKAERGWAYQREMELLAECGFTPREIITAATLNNARFFHTDARLGSLEPGKLADLVLIDGDPLKDIQAMRQVKRVMLNGQWTDAKPVTGAAIYPDKTWPTRTPEQAGMSSNKLAEFSALVGGRGCVVRGGTMVFTWGDQTKSSDVASAFKPLMSTLMLMAVQEGKISGVDEPVAQFEPRLQSLNGGKDAAMTWRHLASQMSGYGLSEKPGEAYSYNDYAITFYYDTLMEKVFGTNGTEVLRTHLAEPLHFEDAFTFNAFGPNNRPGRLGLSVRDFARFGLLYLRGGQWSGRQLLRPEFARMAISSPISPETPLSRGIDADMLAKQRSMGGTKNITPVGPGYYSFNWWLNTTNRAGERMFVAAPPDAYFASGHGGIRVLAIFPSLDLIASWNESRIDDHDKSPGNPNTKNNRALALLVQACLR
jgi:imidazolonepropionase-like amidohydrolase/CubicO group peptidase (beta-lactamase class C family)